MSSTSHFQIQPEDFAENNTSKRNNLSNVSLTCSENEKFLVMHHFVDDNNTFNDEENQNSQKNAQLLSSFPIFYQQNTTITPLNSMCNLQRQIEFTDFFYQAEDIVEYFQYQDPFHSNPVKQEEFEKNGLHPNIDNKQILLNQLETASRIQSDSNGSAENASSEDNFFQFLQQNSNFSENVNNPDSFSTQYNENNLSLSLNPNEESILEKEKPIFLFQSPFDQKNNDYLSQTKETDLSLKEFEQDIKIIPSEISSQLESTKDIEEKHPASGSFSASTLLCLEEFSDNYQKQVKQNNFKSIFNAFRCFVKTNKMEIKGLFPPNKDMDNQLKQLGRHLKHHSFNHTVLKYIVNHEIYCVIFQHFIEFKSSSWIQKSKILNKQAAKEVLSILQACLKDKSSIDHFVCYKTTGKKNKQTRAEKL